MVGMAGTEATAITGTTVVIMAMVIITGMVITAIVTTSTFITAAGNGAPTARSMSATATIDSR